MFLRPVINHHQPVFVAAHHYAVCIDVEMFGNNFIVDVKVAYKYQFRNVAGK